MKDRFSKTMVLKVLLFLSFFSSKAFAQAETKGATDVVIQQIDTVKHLVDILIEFSVKYSFQVLGGILVLVLGWIVSKIVGKFIYELLHKYKVDITVGKFIVGFIKLIIIGFAFIVALGKFGIEIAPLIAGISVVGFGTSFALQGPLSNYASGVTLIFTKPFKVGDIIEVAGVTGEVLDMKLPRTELKTVDGETIVIPNKHIVGEVIHNYSDQKRVDIKVGISYKSDVEKAINVVTKVVKDEAHVSKAKEPRVGISEFADSSINIYARLWCKQDDYWDVLFSINKNIFDAFIKNQIEIPFPQRDVHIIEKKKA
ncbi:MAG: mechanosensitive ion channel [Candidatus Omnitrophica bacterium]|nr:mechanosensitive ion channel [Candidatus Omnitrophota bacterium]